MSEKEPIEQIDLGDLDDVSQPDRRIELGEAVARAIEKLDKGDIKKFSFLNPEEERVFALWLSVANDYDLNTIKRFIINSLCLRVSLEGKGRQDIVNIASSAVASQREQETGGFGSGLRRLIGM